MRDQCLETVAATTNVPAVAPVGATATKRSLVFAEVMVFTTLTSERRKLLRERTLNVTG